jgi:hypothetical protein
MKPSFPLGLLISTFVGLSALVGCKSVRVNVPLDNAKVSDGYINSRTLSLGYVFLWDTQSNRLTKINIISPNMVDPDVSIFLGSLYASRNSGLSSSTNMTFGGSTPLAPGTKVELAGAISESSEVELLNYQAQTYRDARFALNCPKLRYWRESLAETYPDPKYKFLFVSSIVLGKQISISLEKGGLAKIKASVPDIGKADLSVTFNRRISTSIVADSSAPLVVDPELFVLRSSTRRIGFEHDTNTPFDFQSLIATSRP